MLGYTTTKLVENTYQKNTQRISFSFANVKMLVMLLLRLI